MSTINQYKFRKLLKKQDNRCFYCLQHFSKHKNGVNALKKVTVDHVIPRAELKDKSYIEQNTCNTVLACTECNRRKATISAELFLEGYEALNIAPYDEPSFYIPVKTRSKRRFYHRYISWK